MSFSRRTFLRSAGLSALAAPFVPKLAQANLTPTFVRKPKRLAPGSVVGLVTPASQVGSSDVNEAASKLRAMGLQVKFGEHILDQYGYLGGQDHDRAADINNMFADPEVDAILAVRGGWGCTRLFPYLDFDLIRRNPKIIMGYSDITSLLIALYVRSNVVTFHGPVGTATWNSFTKYYVNEVLFEAGLSNFNNQTPSTSSPTRVKTIRSGTSEGILIGGNLSVICGMMGSPYVPTDWSDKILYLEDVDEDIYRVDRMLTHLKIAGVLSQVRGVVFGDCRSCNPNQSPALTLNDVLWDHLSTLGVPAWYGSMIGHIPNKFTIPNGVRARIDAVAGTIQMLEPAVE
ncbi:MAG: LD-carboxypeptidase [Rhodothermia bacterium]|nr:LD-carboxypeptidase [Rhodothermia bacterium]